MQCSGGGVTCASENSCMADRNADRRSVAGNHASPTLLVDAGLQRSMFTALAMDNGGCNTVGSVTGLNRSANPVPEAVSSFMHAG